MLHAVGSVLLVIAFRLGNESSALDPVWGLLLKLEIIGIEGVIKDIPNYLI